MKIERDPELCNKYAKIAKGIQRGTENHDDEKYGTQYLLETRKLKSGDKTVIRFRGSDVKGKDLFLDWFWNFWFFPLPTKPYKGSQLYFIHRGFLKRYKRDEVRRVIYKHIADNKPAKIEISGYSLGAALATICYEDMLFQYGKELGEENITCTVGGNPRVAFFIGSGKFKKRVKNMKSYIHGNDIVVRLPFNWLGFVNSSSKENTIYFCKAKNRSWFPFSKKCVKDHVDFDCCFLD